MAGSIKIFIGDVNDVEAHVFARYVDSEAGDVHRVEREPIILQGIIRGPYCEHAHTLPAEFKFHSLTAQQPGLAKAIITDPCLWSPALPQLYQVVVKAFCENQLVAVYEDQLGLKRATPRRPGFEFPG